jgi:hypothetical protein
MEEKPIDGEKIIKVVRRGKEVMRIQDVGVEDIIMVITIQTITMEPIKIIIMEFLILTSQSLTQLYIQQHQLLLQLL